jgi:hypothetical protein
VYEREAYIVSSSEDYSGTLSVAGLCSVKWKDDKLIGRGLKGSGRDLIYYLVILLGGGERQLRKLPVWTAGIPLRIRREHAADMSLYSYHYISPLC